MRRKARNVVVRSIIMPIAVPVVLLVRLIRPWFLIRFVHIRSDVIAHRVWDPEHYLSGREWDKSKTIDCFYILSGNPPPNEQWTIMVRRNLRISSFYWSLDIVNRLIPGVEMHHKEAVTLGSSHLNGYFVRTKPHIKFISEEDDHGRQFLEKIV